VTKVALTQINVSTSEKLMLNRSNLKGVGSYMFEVAQIEQSVSREDFERISAPLRLELLRLQDQLKSEDFSVVLIFAGAATAGKAEALDLLNEWMDPRWIVTHAYGPPTNEERERPPYWRYWRDLPPKGQIGLFVGSWYHQPVQEYVYGNIGKAEFVTALDGIAAFERTLTDSGTLLLKFWMYLDPALQKKRMKELEKDKNQSWRISKQDWKHFKHNDRFEKTNQIAIEKTNCESARWVVINGADRRFRSLSVLTTLRDALQVQCEARRRERLVVKAIQEQLARERAAELNDIGSRTAVLDEQSRVAAARKGVRIRKTAKVSTKGGLKPLTVLDQLDMSLALSDQKYSKALQAQRAELGDLCRRLHFEGKSAVLVFEGPDAAGKGGAIRRITGSMDARDYRVIPIAKPTEEERAQHYLWRFWRHLPHAGRITIFDRSWYGRVLVERVEGFTQHQDWQRSYGEINAFEEQMAASGIILVKFWVHITKDEQYRRFKDREEKSFKAWKLTPEDWRNRAKWDDYALAVHDMVERTSTRAAPWTLVEGNDKKYARIKVMSRVSEALRKGLAHSNGKGGDGK
jgi:polyphosphate kinase 2 (PPK2 family)